MPALDLSVRGVSTGTVADYTHAGLIIPELRERDPAGIISELSQVLQRHGCLPDVLPFYHAALNQELLASSAVEYGLAFPHARLNGVKRLQFAVGRAREPVVWGPKRSTPIQLVFLLAVPATDAAPYLQLLAALARLGQCSEILAELRHAPKAEAILSALRKLKMRQE
ncbi:MAG TPA: PTS sugar transporter subunit IIA [Candidatus Limnocylindrales bacterium]|jgi:mannitol/fructose-specific phosphotransferase system IIA component (Ntr-type)|nr:PTS sugar transporter subunit IIA [Candidatus Limnocylindrales bacterium]